MLKFEWDKNNFRIENGEENKDSINLDVFYLKEIKQNRVGAQIIVSAYKVIS